MEKIVPDTSIIIEGLLSKKLEKDLKVETILIHEAVLSELEHQANQGKAIGTLGLDEIKRLKDLEKKLKFKIEFKGKRPDSTEIKHASLGEIDALIRDLAYQEDAILITGDKVQSKVAEAKGMKVQYIEPVIKHKKLKLEKYFDKITMSVHLRETQKPYAKKGSPGDWRIVNLSNKPLTERDLLNLSKEIVEETKIRKDAFIELERKGSLIIQFQNYRIVITRPPFSDAREITAVRPIKKLSLSDYQISDKLKQRIEIQAEGILIAGSPGEGKSSFATALAEYYASKEKTVKTIESPRDLQVGDSITQYAISHGSQQEINDVLLLTRPDYTIFDEMRNFEDFRLFSDLRLSGLGLIGVIHATAPVDSIQRFIGKQELGVIPQIIDTVLFIKGGQIHKVLALKMVVKVPSGMIEADLARPVVEVCDFETNKLEYEIYSYGEETVVVPVTHYKKTPAKEFASKHLEAELKKLIPEAKAEVISENRATIYVPSSKIASIIGKGGNNIEQIEKKLGININVEPLIEESKDRKKIDYNLNEKKNHLVFYVPSVYSGKEAEIVINDSYLMSAFIGKKGEIRINKKNKYFKEITKAFDNKLKVRLMI